MRHLGQKRQSSERWGNAHLTRAMSALPPKADMCGATRYVRFVPIADINFAATRLSVEQPGSPTTDAVNSTKS